MDSSDSDQENNSQPVRKTSQQRKLCYRHLLNKVEELSETDNLSLQTMKDIGAILKDANTLDEEYRIDDRIEHADETLLDVMVLASASNVLKKCIQAVDVFTTTYEPGAVATRYINYIRNLDRDNSTTNDDNEEFGTQDLMKLLNDARAIVPEVPCYASTYAYDLTRVPQPKPVKERQQRLNSQRVVEKKQPQKVTQSGSRGEVGINEIVKTLYDLLMDEYRKNDNDPIRYYDYVVDTDDFSATVDNMFFCSFLVRDGRAHINIDGKGVPFIKPMVKRDLTKFRDEHCRNTQMISTISYEEWAKFKKPGFIQIAKK